MTRTQSNDIKQQLRAQGHTVKSWAEAKGYKYRDVSDVIRGIRRGYFGTGREIAIALGLNPDGDQRAA